MKRLRSPIAVILAAIMLLSCSPLTAFAQQSITKELWDSYYSTSQAEIDAAITLTPGSNETERYISWYSESETGSVVITEENASSREYKATAKKTAQGDYRLCATVTGLSTNKTYAYKCKSDKFTSNTYTFTTNTGSFTALYLTDIHISNDKFEENSVRETAYAFNETVAYAQAKSAASGNSIDLILSAGDQASLGMRDEYTGFASSPFVRRIPTATTVGNHDRKSVDYRYFTHQPNTAKMNLKSYVGTDYWFVKGDVLFLVIDSNNISMADHRRFVKEATEANPDVKWRVAMFHHDLYSGRIPHRESENELLRAMWAPIADEYGIDLCLLGHSHYYTVSNVLYNNKTVEKTADGATVTNPKGTVYMVSGSLNNPRNDDEIGLSENIGHAHLTSERIYNLIDFSEDSITVNSYTVESDKKIGSFTIEKTSNEGGHNYKSPAAWYYPLIEFISAVAGIFNNIGMYADYTDLGFKLTFLEGLLGK